MSKFALSLSLSFFLSLSLVRTDKDSVLYNDEIICSVCDAVLAGKRDVVHHMLLGKADPNETCKSTGKRYYLVCVSCVCVLRADQA